MGNPHQYTPAGTCKARQCEREQLSYLKIAAKNERMWPKKPLRSAREPGTAGWPLRALAVPGVGPGGSAVLISSNASGMAPSVSRATIGGGGALSAAL